MGKGNLTNFREAIYTKDFALITECILRPESNAESIRLQADIIGDCTDAVLLTDNQHGQLHMSSLAAARLMLDNGIDPVMQLSCRNRNRIVLLSDLLGASALGVTSLLLVRGDQVPAGFDPRPKAVFDVNAKELISTASTMNEDERLNPPPNFFIGGVVLVAVAAALAGVVARWDTPGHVVSAEEAPDGTRLTCRDLRTRNFGTRFGDLELLVPADRMARVVAFHV